jgi:virginiamycin B lyase
MEWTRLIAASGLVLGAMLAISGEVDVAMLSGTAAAAGAVREFALPRGGSPTAIAAGADGALWFIASPTRIGRITTAGKVTEFPISPGGPLNIAGGPDGALWLTKGKDNAQPVIGRMTTTGAFNEFPLAVGSSCGPPAYTDCHYLWDIAAGADGALWFTESGEPGLASKIGRITTGGKITEFPLPSCSLSPSTSGGCGGKGIAAGPDGALWFTEYFLNKIGRITTGGNITEFPLPSRCGLLGCGPGGSEFGGGITAGPDGALWFTERAGNRIGRITLAGQIREFPLRRVLLPADIAAGPDGALWFTSGGTNAIGRITPAGKVTVFTAGARNNPYSGITAGPDGAVWFTEFFDNKIGRITAGAGIFGAKTRVTLKLAKKRIRYTGPLAVRVTNANDFQVTGKLSGPTLKPTALRVAAHAQETVKLKLPKALREVLKRKHNLSVRVTAKVKDPAGHVRTIRKKVSPNLKQMRHH